MGPEELGAESGACILGMKFSPGSGQREALSQLSGDCPVLGLERVTFGRRLRLQLGNLLQSLPHGSP